MTGMLGFLAGLAGLLVGLGIGAAIAFVERKNRLRLEPLLARERRRVCQVTRERWALYDFLRDTMPLAQSMLRVFWSQGGEDDRAFALGEKLIKWREFNAQEESRS